MLTVILIHVPCIIYYFVLPSNYAQFIYKWSNSYIFRHYHVILGELIIPYQIKQIF